MKKNFLFTGAFLVSINFITFFGMRAELPVMPGQGPLEPAPIVVAPVESPPMIPPTDIEPIPAMPPEGLDFPEEQLPVSTVVPGTEEELVRYQYDQDLELLKRKMDEVERKEDLLIGKLRELEKKIDEAQKQAVDARLISNKVLQAETSQDAQNKLDELNVKLTQMQNIQNYIQTDFTQSFDQAVLDIQNQIQELQGQAAQLTARGEDLSKKMEVPERKKKKKKVVKFKSAWANKAATFVASIVQGTFSVVDWFKELIKSLMPDEKEKREVAAGAEPIEPLLPEAAQVEIAQFGVPPEPVQSVSLQQVITPAPPVGIPAAEVFAAEEQVTTTKDPLTRKLEERLKKFETTINELSQEQQKLEFQRQKLEALKGKRLMELKQTYTTIKQAGMDPKIFLGETPAVRKSWIRSNLENVFGKVLDASAVIIEGGTRVYRKLVSPRIDRFVKAVRTRIEKEGVAEVLPAQPIEIMQPPVAPVMPPTAEMIPIPIDASPVEMMQPGVEPPEFPVAGPVETVPEIGLEMGPFLPIEPPVEMGPEEPEPFPELPAEPLPGDEMPEVAPMTF